MQHATKRGNSLAVAVGLLAALAGARLAAQPITRPRIAVLPWLVVDRTTNRELTRASSGEAGAAEARLLGQSAQSTLDRSLHKQDLVDLVPRSEWEQYWTPEVSGRALRAPDACAVCTPSGQLLRYDREEIRKAARAVHADYVWLGIVVVPLTWEAGIRRTEECCRESLALDREQVLARSTAVLVRAADGEAVWEKDVRRADVRDGKYRVRYGLPDMPRTDSGHERVGTEPETPARPSYQVRESAVDATARRLAEAFRRDHSEVFR